MYKTNLKYESIGSVHGGQDGAIYGGYVVRFGGAGDGCVTRLDTREELCRFTVDRVDEFKPHSNAVFFGTEKYDENDEFPLLYTNLYNNYYNCEDQREGMLCVYRLTRDGNDFSTKLVQLIRIGFVNNLALWRSMEDGSDIRPYGNFILDTDTNKLYAFVIRDKDKVTRYFEFDMPRLADGDICPKCGLPVVKLTEEMITAQFDGEYSHYIQGACVSDSLLYSTEGGTVRDANATNPSNPPRLQVMDLKSKTQVADVALWKFGLLLEPEFISYYDGKLYYSDCSGAMFVINSIE